MDIPSNLFTGTVGGSLANQTWGHTTNVFCREVWVIFLITVISSFAYMFGVTVRDCIERSVQSMLPPASISNRARPLPYYWLYAGFLLGLFILLVIIIRFALLT